MATNYPGSLDTTAGLKNDAADGTVTAVTHAGAHNNVADALIALETALGVNPGGSFASVASALLNAIFQTPNGNQVIQPGSDHVALICKAGSALFISNLFEGRLANDTIVAFLDKSGNMSAQAFKVNGTPLAANHLSNGVQGSGAVVLATSPTITTPTIVTPTLTGTPVAPTPAGGDNSTKVATTAFVGTAIAGLVQPTSGTLASRPAASAMTHSFYYATDQAVLYFSDGTTWYRQGFPTGATTMLLGASAAVPTGWVRYDGGTLAGSTGIYADLYAHLGNTTTLPDTRSRMLLDKGTNTVVDTIGKNDGVAIADRRPQHRHTPHHHSYNFGDAGGTGNGANAGATVSTPTTSNDGGSGVATDSLDTSPYIVGLLIAKL